MAPFTPSKEATAHQIAAQLTRREQIAQQFIEAAPLGYVKLNSEPNITMLSSRVGKDNLVRDPNKVRDLEKLSNQYFGFRTELFKFQVRQDRTAWDLLQRPQSYADLEEENIEEKFPEDIESRALICALGRVIGKNRWKHIVRKRLLQIVFSLPMVALLLWWPSLIVAIENMTPIVRDLSSGLSPASRSYLVGAIMISVVAVVAVALTARLRYLLGHHTLQFTAVNESSCQILARVMTSVHADIVALFNKLIKDDITTSQVNFEDVSRQDWVENAKKVFRAALWEAKRMEYLERFWQLRLERLRLFEIVGNEIGNLTSRAVAVAILAVSLWLAPNLWHPVTVAIAVGIWYIGWTTRKQEYGFDMDRIEHQGFQKAWKPFCDLGYYEKIAQEYGDSKNQIRTFSMQNVFGAGSPSGQKRPGSSG
jgi:hypothetical protein